MSLRFRGALSTASCAQLTSHLLLLSCATPLRYCIAHSDAAVQRPDVRTRALIPVAFGRPKAETDNVQTALRNKWCLVSADMHVNEPDCKKR